MEAENPDGLEILREQDNESLEASLDMFASQDEDEEDAFNFNMDAALNSSSLEIEIQTDSASEDENTLNDKFGMIPFLLTKYNDRSLDIKGEGQGIFRIHCRYFFFSSQEFASQYILSHYI